MANRQIDLENIDRVEDLVYAPLEKKYLKVQCVCMVLSYLGLMMATLLVLFIEKFEYRYVVTVALEGMLAVALIVNGWLLPKAYGFKGYAVREQDVTFRTGIIFPKVTTIPYRKIQQLSVRQSLVSRLFGLYTLDVVNGSQLFTISIPGLTEARAMEIKALIIKIIQDEQA